MALSRYSYGSRAIHVVASFVASIEARIRRFRERAVSFEWFRSLFMRIHPGKYVAQNSYDYFEPRASLIVLLEKLYTGFREFVGRGTTG